MWGKKIWRWCPFKFRCRWWCQRGKRTCPACLMSRTARATGCCPPGPSAHSSNQTSPQCAGRWAKYTYIISAWKVMAINKEDIKEQPTPRNLANATKVPHCTVHAQLQLLGNIFQLFTPHLNSPQLTSTQLTLDYVNNIILHLLSVLCTAVNARNKN